MVVNESSEIERFEYVEAPELCTNYIDHFMSNEEAAITMLHAAMVSPSTLNDQHATSVSSKIESIIISPKTFQ